MTLGSGQIEVRQPRVRDTPSEQEAFESRIIAPYQKLSRTVSELFPNEQTAAGVMKIGSGKKVMLRI